MEKGETGLSFHYDRDAGLPTDGGKFVPNEFGGGQGNPPSLASVFRFELRGVAYAA